MAPVDTVKIETDRLRWIFDVLAPASGQQTLVSADVLKAVGLSVDAMGGHRFRLENLQYESVTAAVAVTEIAVDGGPSQAPRFCLCASVWHVVAAVRTVWLTIRSDDGTQEVGVLPGNTGEEIVPDYQASARCFFIPENWRLWAKTRLALPLTLRASALMANLEPGEYCWSPGGA